MPKSILRRLPLSWLTLSFVIALTDQFSKYTIESWIDPYQTMVILPFLNFTLDYNPGIGFGLFSKAEIGKSYLLIMVMILMIGSLVKSLYDSKRYRQHPQTSLGISLILGGGLSHLYERTTQGFVVDFIDLHLAGLHSSFNLADAAVIAGLALLLFSFNFGSLKRRLNVFRMRTNGRSRKRVSRR